MRTQKWYHRPTLYHRLFVASLVASTFVAVASLIGARSQQALAATDSTINFQARLMTGSGGIVPDGNYNVEFKIYNSSSSSGSSQGSCSGDSSCLWVETRTSANVVRVANGYLTVNLGSVSSLPTTINWDQDLYLGLNIGGTGGTPSWDGEMTPRLHLTAVPYAFRAGALAANNGSNTATLSFTTPTANDAILLPDASGTVCLQNASACGFAPTSGSTNYIQNATGVQNANFFVKSASSSSVAGIIQAASGSTVDAFEVKAGGGGNLFAISGNTNIATLTDQLTINGQDTNNPTLIVNGPSSLSANVANFEVNGTNIYTFTNNGQLVAGNSSNTGQLSLFDGGGSGKTGTLTVGTLSGYRTYTLPDASGTVCLSTGNCTGSATTLQSAYNSSTGGSTPEIKLNSTNNGLDIQDADTTLGSGQNFLSLRSSNASGLGSIEFGFGIAGNFFMQPSADSTTAFQLQGHTGGNLFVVDSTNKRVGIALGGSTLPGYTLDVAGDINTGTALRVGGTSVCDTTGSTGCLAKSGSGYYIHNQTTVQTSASFYIQGGTGNVTGILEANGADILDLQNSSAANVATFGATGAVLFQTSTNTATAFQVKTASPTSATVLDVDTSNTRVGIGTAAPNRTLDVAVNNATTTGPPLLVEQAGTGDASIEIKTPAKSWIVGADASNASALTINSSTAANNATLGNTGGASTDSSDQNTYECSQFTASQTGTATSISVKTGTSAASSPNNSYSLAIYSGTSSQPTTLVASASGTLAAAAGVNTLAITASITSGTIYWLCGNNNSNNSNNSNWSYDTAASGQGWFLTSQPYASGWSATITNGSGSASTQRFAMYVSLTPSGSYDSFNSALFTMSDTGQITAKNSANSTSAFQIQNTSGTSYFSVDTTNERIYVGPSGGDTTGAVLVVGNKTNAGDPSEIDGGMYYNGNTRDFRCGVNGSWVSCTSGTRYVQHNQGSLSGNLPPATDTVSNTTTATTFGDKYSVPANSCVNGRTFRLTAGGVISYPASTNTAANMNILWGSTTIGVSDPGATIPYSTGATANTNVPWYMEALLTCYTNFSGTLSVEVEGQLTISDQANAPAEVLSLGNNSIGQTVTTTSAQNVALQWQWGTASTSRSITLRNMTVESLGP